MRVATVHHAASPSRPIRNRKNFTTYRPPSVQRVVMPIVESDFVPATTARSQIVRSEKGASKSSGGKGRPTIPVIAVQASDDIDWVSDPPPA
jgi:hypothetical protein